METKCFIIFIINTQYSWEGLMLKLWYLGHLTQRANSSEKTLMLGKTEGKEEKGTTEDEMVGWRHQLHGHEFGQTPGHSEGQRHLACCSPWGCKELHTTEWPNNHFFTVLCWFLLCNVYQLQGYVHPLPLEPPGPFEYIYFLLSTR